MFNVSVNVLGEFVQTAIHAETCIKSYKDDLQAMKVMFRDIMDINNISEIRTPKGVVRRVDDEIVFSR